MSDGISHVDAYLSELYRAGEISFDDYYDSEWRSELKERVREALEAELTGAHDESRENAELIAEEIVDGELVE